LKNTARNAPVRSRTSISKILKPGRRVGLMAELMTSASTDDTMPGRSEAMVRNAPRSS